MEGLLDNVRQLQKELKLYGTLIDSYIPPEYMKMIERYVFWNEDIGDWQLKCIAYTGNNMRAAKHNPPLVYRSNESQIKAPYLSYADLLDSPAQPQQISTPSRGAFRPKSAKKDRNAARIKALLE